MRVAGRASDPAAEPPTGVKPKPFAASDSGGVAAALTTSERGRASEHGRKTGRENPRFRPPADPDTKPYSGSQTHGNPGRSVGSTASVGNTAHMKQLERAWNAQLSQSGGGGGGGDGESVYKSGYSVDLMSTRELMELRRGIEATLDVRGVAPVSTYAPAAAAAAAAVLSRSVIVGARLTPRRLRSVTYDWHTDAGEAGTVTARVAQERPQSAGAGRERPEWMGACPDDCTRG